VNFIHLEIDKGSLGMHSWRLPNQATNLCVVQYDFCAIVTQVELEKLRRCSDREICDCRKMYNLDKLPWSNRFSHTLKQLSIARCPRVCILCFLIKHF